ncbi:MAG: hypothetical protein C4308_01940 [Chitinophagaceae bacterium]
MAGNHLGESFIIFTAINEEGKVEDVTVDVPLHPRFDATIASRKTVQFFGQCKYLPSAKNKRKLFS